MSFIVNEFVKTSSGHWMQLGQVRTLLPLIGHHFVSVVLSISLSHKNAYAWDFTRS